MRRAFKMAFLFSLALFGTLPSVRADIKWAEKEKEHKVNSGGGGAEHQWRDAYLLQDYVVYDYTIHVISVRGGGSWWGSDLTEQSIKSVGEYYGVDASTEARLTAEKIKGGGSSDPHPEIEQFGVALEVKGLTRAQPTGGRGGNVKYAIAVCFISKNDLQRLPAKGGHRLAVMGVRHSGKEFDNDKVTINDDITAILSNPTAGNPTTPIAVKYSQLGGPQGFLGAALDGTPGAGEKATPDHIGRFVRFQGGSIYWSPSTGAHEVHGLIYDKWSNLKWEAGILGYPTTDETITPDKIGRFSAFQHGSIYYSPKTGAHVVHGAIRDEWAENGWEAGYLGYPTSDEENTNDGKGRISQFQNGYIDYYASTGAADHQRGVPAPPEP